MVSVLTSSAVDIGGVMVSVLASSVVDIGGGMVSVLASSAVDLGFEPRSDPTKTTKLVFVASPLSTQH
jgi:hypothetical protein